ncbi:Alpha/beta hydrolase fold-3 domain protein [Shewanella halifaxensis HAW-EB4]|uniref:Alpha/beta hydrolase fold-3 domain protein n=1 Tax=Shewanella halifaxensis (strain HAW-EB4) TaxID=458817 RepID=B0TLR6_SHEHH|nr:alpha/beta hydrolase [Shewanella halifaxensis]ABZ77288.1 Alpha/beta hydrolase fold-3 domain protein [Shewanella halifaxensis HAW-EB4]
MRNVSEKLKPWLDNFNTQIAVLIENGFKPTATNAREGLANLTKGLVTNIPDIAWVADDLVMNEQYNVPVRIYHPVPTKKLPVIVYFHGGGHMAGSVTVYDPICRKLANATQHIVVSVDYRLAPECPYPAGVNDGYAVVEGIWAVLDGRSVNYQKQLSVVGDSGGGALVASVSGRAQFDKSVIIDKQVMIYPSLDYTMDTPSMDQNAVGYLLQKGKIGWYFDNYFSEADDRVAASPLHGNLTRALPETLVFTAEFCPLRDEGKMYVDKVKQAGGKAELIHFDDMIHTFLNMEDLVQAECDLVYRTMGEFLNR